MTTEPSECGAGASGDDAEISDCDDAVRQLYAFLDNELTEHLRSDFESHLNRCRPCVDIVTFEAELRKVIANKCQDRVPEELRIRIEAAIFRESGRTA